MQVVYVKEKRLRVMMRMMHGLAGTAYWIVMYSWFLLVCRLYLAIFVSVGSVHGPNIPRKDS